MQSAFLVIYQSMYFIKFIRVLEHFVTFFKSGQYVFFKKTNDQTVDLARWIIYHWLDFNIKYPTSIAVSSIFAQSFQLWQKYWKNFYFWFNALFSGEFSSQKFFSILFGKERGIGRYRKAVIPDRPPLNWSEKQK